MRRRREGGFSLVAAMAAITIMLIMMGAAVPSWRYVMKNMREEELIFRGTQIARAIKRFQAKNGGAAPTSMEQLVKGKFLRKAWTDPMTRSGKWHLLGPNEVRPFEGSKSGRPGPGRRGPGGDLGGERGDAIERRRLGVFVGVATTSTDESFRIVNGQTRYDQWLFVAGREPVIGRPQGLPGIGLPPSGTGGVFPGGPRPEKPEPSPQNPR